MTSFKETFDEIYYGECLKNTTVIERSKCILEDAVKKNYTIVVLTNKRQEIAQKICAHFFPNLEMLVIGRTNGVPIKPYCTVLERLESYGLATMRCHAYYGNSETDEQMASLLKVTYYEITKLP